MTDAQDAQTDSLTAKVQAVHERVYSGECSPDVQAELQKLLQEDLTNASRLWTLYALALALLNHDDLAGAEERLRTGIDLFASAPINAATEVYVMGLMAEVCWQQQRPDEAIRWLDRARSHSEGRPLLDAWLDFEEARWLLAGPDVRKTWRRLEGILATAQKQQASSAFVKLIWCHLLVASLTQPHLVAEATSRLPGDAQALGAYLSAQAHPDPWMMDFHKALVAMTAHPDFTVELEPLLEALRLRPRPLVS